MAVQDVWYHLHVRAPTLTLSDQGQTVLAQMDLTAPDGLPIVLMEKFEQLTRKVDCNADDDILSLTFIDQRTYKYAISTWSYINEDAHKRFLLITNHASCSPADERQAYYINSVDDVAEQQTVYLRAEKAKWADITGTYDLTWGSANPTQHRRLARRDWWDDVKDALGDAYKATAGAVTDVVNDITGAGTSDQTKAYTFPVSGGNPGVTSNVFTDPTGRLKLDCLDCHSGGNFHVTGHVKITAFQPQEVSISAQPGNFQANVKLRATISASTSPVTLSGQQEIVSYPIPYAGIAVPNVFKVGAVFSYAIGWSTTFKGRNVVDFGLNATLPNSAVANLVVAGSTLSSATGFDAPLLSRYIDLVTVSASVTVAAYSKPALNFGIELTNIGTANVQLAMNVPEISSTLTASYAAAGVCPTDTSKQVFGVNLSNQVKVSLGVSANANLGPLVPASWGRELWSHVWPLPAFCWPITFPIDVT